MVGWGKEPSDPFPKSVELLRVRVRGVQSLCPVRTVHSVQRLCTHTSARVCWHTPCVPRVQRARVVDANCQYFRFGRVGGWGLPQTPPPLSEQKNRKFTIRKIWSGHLWYITFWVLTPPPLRHCAQCISDRTPSLCQLCLTVQTASRGCCPRGGAVFGGGPGVDANGCRPDQQSEGCNRMSPSSVAGGNTRPVLSRRWVS